MAAFVTLQEGHVHTMRRVQRRTFCVIVGLAAMIGGCELIASIDRTKIVPAENTAGRGSLDRYENGFVFGWAMGEPKEIPVMVRIEINGTPTTTVSADQPRPDLLQKGVHPTGNAGFKVDVGMLAAGTEIRAFIDVTNVELAHSPLIVEGGGAGGSDTGGTGGTATGGTGGTGGMGGTSAGGSGGTNTGGMGGS